MGVSCYISGAEIIPIEPDAGNTDEGKKVERRSGIYLFFLSREALAVQQVCFSFLQNPPFYFTTNSKFKVPNSKFGCWII
jgi:hypothetical protein